MPLPGHPEAQPVSYRLALTLSLAFLLHTLLLACLVHWKHKLPEKEPTTVRLTLMQPGNTPSQRSQKSASSLSSHPRKTSDSAPAAAPQALPVISRPDETAEVTPPEPTPPEHDRPDQKDSAVSRESKPSEQPSINSPSSEASVASKASGAGAPIETHPLERDSDQVQIPDKAVDQDPYITLLWHHISKELDQRPVRSIHSLKRIRTVRLELYLMDNGTLRQVDMMESSGETDLDRAARQSALAASPYPEPPESAREKGFRFQVELRFTPRGT